MPGTGKFRAYFITHNPGGGVTDTELQLLHSYIATKSIWYFMCVEKDDDKRHCHILAAFERLTNKSNMKNMLLSIPDFGINMSKIQQKLFNVKIWYDHNCYLKYLTPGETDRKIGDKYELYAERLPEDLDDLIKYYPLPDDDSIKRPISVYYVKLEKLFLQDWTVNRDNRDNPKFYKAWLHNRMFHHRDIEIIADQRKAWSIATNLMHFLHHDEEHFGEVDPYDGKVRWPFIVQGFAL
jgi:hypothetical protein